MARHIVALADEIPPGGQKVVTVRGREIVIYNIAGEHFALLNRCPHEGAALSYGARVGLATSKGPGDYSLSRIGEIVRCPWHGWEFDIKTGKSYCDPGHTFVKQYAVTTEPGAVVAEGPFRAETFTISTEENYLVVDL